MTTSSEHATPLAQAEPAGLNLQTDQAKAIVAAIKADNAALEQADQVAEAQAEAVVEQARQLDEVAEEVLGELQDAKPAGPV
jgi:hypothetical protein